MSPLAPDLCVKLNHEPHAHRLKGRDVIIYIVAPIGGHGVIGSKALRCYYEVQTSWIKEEEVRPLREICLLG